MGQTLLLPPTPVPSRTLIDDVVFLIGIVSPLVGTTGASIMKVRVVSRNDQLSQPMDVSEGVQDGGRVLSIERTETPLSQIAQYTLWIYNSAIQLVCIWSLFTSGLLLEM